MDHLWIVGSVMVAIMVGFALYAWGYIDGVRS